MRRLSRTARMISTNCSLWMLLGCCMYSLITRSFLLVKPDLWGRIILPQNALGQTIRGHSSLGDPCLLIIPAKSTSPTYFFGRQYLPSSWTMPLPSHPAAEIELEAHLWISNLPVSWSRPSRAAAAEVLSEVRKRGLYLGRLIGSICLSQ